MNNVLWVLQIFAALLSALVVSAGALAASTAGSVMAVGGAANGVAVSATMAMKADVVTSSGQKADEHGNKLGGSGKPQQHETNSNTREGANNKALSEGFRELVTDRT